MTDDNRKHIAYYLDLGWSVARIAKELGRAVSTIWRVVLNRRVDSYTRESLDNETPYDRFVGMYGEDGRDFLDRLGIRRIAGNRVTLHPFLLGQKFQRLADKAILRKNGVTDTRKQTPGK